MAGVDASSPRPAALLARRVTATWWYTASSVVFFSAVALLVWSLPAIVAPPEWTRPWGVPVFFAGLLVAVAATVALLAEYRPATADPAATDDAAAGERPRAVLVVALTATAAAAVAVSLTAGLILPGAGVIAGAICLLRIPPGMRWRLTIVLTGALVALWFIDAPVLADIRASMVVPVPLFSVLLPSMTVLSLWWWDVVVALDRARETESRLAATHERLRLAGELHDLQGHHLQVIALQLELAERMLPGSPAAAAEQVRLARDAVDAARQGTRELAGRFRGVPLPDEIANAADLLRAAGLRVEIDVDADAGLAPADLLGPVVRECTTNVLKHGGGEWARLSLRRDDGAWTLRVANDPGEGRSALGAGAGLSGIAERVAAVGGELRSHGDADGFEAAVTVPAGERR